MPSKTTTTIKVKVPFGTDFTDSEKKSLNRMYKRKLDEFGLTKTKCTATTSVKEKTKVFKDDNGEDIERTYYEATTKIVFTVPWQEDELNGIDQLEYIYECKLRESGFRNMEFESHTKVEHIEDGE